MASGNAVGSTGQITEHSLGYVLDFQRYEFKYKVPNRWSQLLVSELTRFMQFDPYSQDGFSYPLYSVYYDTEDWQAYYEKMDGVERRKKFRVRSYEVDPGESDLVMLEIKEKNKDIILKRRLPVPVGDVGKVGSLEFPLRDEVVAKEWRFNLARDALKPKMLVHYDRMAFVPRTKEEYRITLDSNVRWGHPTSPVDFSARTSAVPALRGSSVLEVKFGKRPPKFIFDLIKRFDLRNDAISKYCESVISSARNIL